MRSKLITRVRGSVLIEIRGKRAEDFVNLLLHNQIECWNINRTENGKLRLELHRKDFLRLRPLLKETGCRARMLRKAGLPFLFKKIRRRSGFVIGLLLFFVLLYGMSIVVWDVQVEGLETISEDAVLLAAKEIGIHKMQLKFKINDPSDLSKKLVQELNGVSWVGVSIEGTKVNIHVVESARPEERPLKNRRHLIATHDAVVSHIIAEKGRPVVKPNTHVNKGDVLISGIVGDEENYEIVVAEGEVRGWVWYEYEVTVPLIQKRKVYTGNTSHHRYVLIGNRGIKMKGYGEETYNKFEVEEQRHTLQWRTFKLPFGWMKETVREVAYDVRHIEPEEAFSIGLEQARSDVLIKAGEQANITDEKVLSKKNGEREVTLRLLFEVDQPIAKEQAIAGDPFEAEAEQKSD